MPPLFDHLVGATEQRCRDPDVERHRGPEVHHQEADRSGSHEQFEGAETGWAARCWRAAGKRDEPALSHSITSSAIASNFAGNSIAMARAAGKLRTSCNLVGRCTGKSAGFAPFRICPVKTPT
jgi:hypothetical protein